MTRNRKRPDAVRRLKATEATKAKYEHRAMSWERETTCVHMARFHLRKMGHKLPNMPRVKSLLSAKRELKNNGWQDTAAMLDQFLERIAPAQMRMGDVAVMQDDSGMGAVVISLGMGWSKVMGWHEDVEGLAIMDVKEFIGAWRG